MWTPGWPETTLWIFKDPLERKSSFDHMSIDVFHKPQGVSWTPWLSISCLDLQRTNERTSHILLLDGVTVKRGEARCSFTTLHAEFHCFLNDVFCFLLQIEKCWSFMYPKRSEKPNFQRKQQFFRAQFSNFTQKQVLVENLYWSCSFCLWWGKRVRADVLLDVDVPKQICSVLDSVSQC